MDMTVDMLALMIKQAFQRAEDDIFFAINGYLPSDLPFIIKAADRAYAKKMSEYISEHA